MCRRMRCRANAVNLIGIGIVIVRTVRKNTALGDMRVFFQILVLLQQHDSPSFPLRLHLLTDTSDHALSGPCSQVSHP